MSVALVGGSCAASSLVYVNTAVATNPVCSPSSSNYSSGGIGYRVLTFTSTTVCDWTVPAGVTSIDYLLVGGGGGGGYAASSGGGGGGLLEATASSVTPTSTLTVTVGSGGAGGISTATTGATGGSSSLTVSSPTPTATGGRGGLFGFSQAGGAGGTGTTSGGAGGRSPTSFPDSGTVGGNGGASSITGTSLTYGGGGGGGIYTTDASLAALGPLAGGAGGGGAGASANSTVVISNPVSGTANLGGGGGAGSSGRVTNGAAGGSGVVIIRYIVNTYTVTYNANEGSVSPTSATFTTGGSALVLPTPTRAGYTFLGWFTALSGGSSAGAAGASYTPASSTTLFARWSANSYTITYNANEGSVTPTSATFSTGGTVVLPTPTRSGFVFAGWFTEASGGSSVGAAGANYAPTATENFTIYAQWTATPAPSPSPTPAPSPSPAPESLPCWVAPNVCPPAKPTPEPTPNVPSPADPGAVIGVPAAVIDRLPDELKVPGAIRAGERIVLMARPMYTKEGLPLQVRVQLDIRGDEPNLTRRQQSKLVRLKRDADDVLWMKVLTKRPVRVRITWFSPGEGNVNAASRTKVYQVAR